MSPTLKPLVDRVLAQLRQMRATAIASPAPQSETRRPTQVAGALAATLPRARHRRVTRSEHPGLRGAPNREEVITWQPLPAPPAPTASAD